MLEIKNLNISYEQTIALKAIDLKIPTGEIYAIIGPSGCGKSTLLGAVANLISTYDGEILLDNEKISQQRHTIGLIPQNYGLLPWKTVYDNILIALQVKGFKKNNQALIKQIDWLLERLNISAYKNRYPNELSGGQKQRVAIARAFALKPDILLKDEPFSALDALTREESQELFLTIWEQEKATTLLITHDIDEAIMLGTKIVLMSPAPGRILKILDNPTFNLKNKRTTAAFLKISSEIRTFMKEEWV